MYKINDLKEKEKFTCLERMTFAFFTSLCLFVLIVRILTGFNFCNFLVDNNLRIYLNDSLEYGVISLMSLVFFSLLFNL